MEDVADKYNLRQYITTGRKVVGARWLEDKQKWQVLSKNTDGRRNVVSSYGITDGEVGDDIVEECDVFINASGFFNHWRWPKTPGRHNFKGVMVHSANYDPELDLRGKRVAVIGNGSSGIQVTAAVQKVAKSLSVYMRHPTWVTANLGSKFIPDGINLKFDEEQKAYWAKNADEYLEYRKAVENELNDGFPFFIQGTKAQQDAWDFTVQDMLQKLSPKPELGEKLVPSYPVGCRRPTPGTGYLEALCSDNCEIVWGELDNFTENGIKSADGTEREFDVIICATGFDMSLTPRWPIIGKNGVDLQKKWKEDPACYLSAIANDMPNYFVYLGPGSPVGHGSLLPSIERVTLYICDIINKLQTQNYSSFLLRAGKAKAWQAHMFAWLQKTVWGCGCHSSFKDGTADGPLHAFHPGSRLHYFELLRLPRYEDFEWTSRCPEPELEFAWLASGFMQEELHHQGEDKA
jgi:cation diffusion facilitator CzcD-associated flavoprotein CzcO